MTDAKTLVHRLRRKTVAGQPVFPTPIEMEAADRIEALEALADEAYPGIAHDLLTAKRRIAALEAALREIAAYPPGNFRPLEDEIAIWKIATEALETELPLSARAEQGIIDQRFPVETKGDAGG